jgi:ABC-type nickel/cobalt efflux system permease component RcnA
MWRFVTLLVVPGVAPYNPTAMADNGGDEKMKIKRSGEWIPGLAPVAVIVATLAWAVASEGHDIPNARVDRSIQVEVVPGRLRIDYELGLSELTLIQDLRALVGSLPGADRRGWFDRYGQVVGPLNASGLEVNVDGRSRTLRTLGFDLAIEDHLRYTFHFEADLPSAGKLSVRDTNYGAGEGTSRLAVRGVGGVSVRGDALPSDVRQIAIRSPWQMKAAEEERTRKVEVEFAPGGEAGEIATTRSSSEGSTSGLAAERLSRLLDRSEIPLAGLLLVAFALGAAHAIQPGHGKSLVAAASIGEGGGWTRGLALALVITSAHMGGVLAVALGLWLTGANAYVEINRSLARGAGFVIAAIGLWRLGRHLGGHSEHTEEAGVEAAVAADPGPGAPGRRGLISLGLAGGVVPCWDAVALILLAEAVDRLGLGVMLLAAFSLGMAAVLVSVGVIAAHIRGLVARREGGDAWSRRLGVLGALAVTAIGLYLMGS